MPAALSAFDRKQVPLCLLPSKQESHPKKRGGGGRSQKRFNSEVPGMEQRGKRAKLKLAAVLRRGGAQKVTRVPLMNILQPCKRRVRGTRKLP